MIIFAASNEVENLIVAGMTLQDRIDQARETREEALAFVRRKRRVTWDDLRAHFIDLALAKDEAALPVLVPLERALIALVREGKLRRYRRYGRPAFEYVRSHGS